MLSFCLRKSGSLQQAVPSHLFLEEPIGASGISRSMHNTGNVRLGRSCCRLTNLRSRTPAAGDLERLWEGSRSVTPTPVERSSALARSARARCSALCTSTNSSRGEPGVVGLTPHWRASSPTISKVAGSKESGIWELLEREDPVKIPNHRSSPVEESKSFGSRFLTTDLALP